MFKTDTSDSYKKLIAKLYIYIYRRDVVKNGFKTTGLYPFTADGINFRELIKPSKGDGEGSISRKVTGKGSDGISK